MENIIWLKYYYAYKFCAAKLKIMSGKNIIFGIFVRKIILFAQENNICLTDLSGVIFVRTHGFVQGVLKTVRGYPIRTQHIK